MLLVRALALLILVPLLRLPVLVVVLRSTMQVTIRASCCSVSSAGYREPKYYNTLWTALVAQ